MPYDAHKTQTYTICMTKHSHFTTHIHGYLQLHASQYKEKTQHPSHSLHKHRTSFNHPMLTNTILNNGRITTNFPMGPKTIITTNIKINMRHIQTSIVSIHLDTRGNYKILRTPPPHISRSEYILPRITPWPNSGQINHPF